VCDSCHGKIHQYNTTIVPHISEMKYKNLLEMLESLKSQVSDTLMETYRDVEKQLGLTDNQQPSI
jgi:cytochrome c553